MEDISNMQVKEVISKYPGIGDILGSFGIGCVTCAAGSCLFREIVGIHSMPPEKEKELFDRIAAVLPSGVMFKRPAPSTARKREKDGGLKYSPPIKMLVDEHTKIKKLLALIPDILGSLDIEKENDRELIRSALYFIVNYADRFHHAKEEAILFDYADRDSSVIKVMLEDHDLGRSFVKGARQALESKDIDELKKNLEGYKGLLEEHIRKEDEILYPWIDRNLSDAQVGELFRKFSEADIKTDRNALAECLKFIDGLAGAPHAAPSKK